jgi:pimeloyl-ACP methyl ester carboxylesterase
MSSSTVTASDGITLAVRAYTEIDPKRPTVLAIHGYPDNHHLWDGVAAELGGRYNFVAYDVRGAGESERPSARSGYRFPQLISDVGAVIDSLGVGQGVHSGLGRRYRRRGDEQGRVVHVDLGAAFELCGQVLAVGAYSTRPL